MEEGADFVNMISRGSLISIQDWYFKELVKLDDIVNLFNGDDFDFEPNYLARLRSKTHTVLIDDELIALFLICKMYFRIREKNAMIRDKRNIIRKVDKFY